MPYSSFQHSKVSSFEVTVYLLIVWFHLLMHIIFKWDLQRYKERHKIKTDIPVGHVVILQIKNVAITYNVVYLQLLENVNLLV